MSKKSNFQNFSKNFFKIEKIFLDIIFFEKIEKSKNHIKFMIGAVFRIFSFFLNFFRKIFKKKMFEKIYDL